MQDVQDSNLERSKNRSLIYAGGVRADGVRQGEAIGVLGILFDWDTEAQTILNTCLPQDSNGEVLAGSAAFYTNAQHEIIETTDEERFPVGMVPPLPLSISKSPRANHELASLNTMELAFLSAAPTPKVTANTKVLAGKRTFFGPSINRP